MNKFTKTIAAITVALTALTQLPLHAQDRATASDEGLRIATGQKGKGYSRLFADLRTVCGGQSPITEVVTEGGLQNLTTLAANRAELGFVQLDTLQDMKESDEAIGSLVALMPINTNLLHILARSSGYTYRGPDKMWGALPGDQITVTPGKFSELKGLPIAVVGSARKLGRTLDRSFAMNLQFVDVETDDQALTKLRTGKVAAIFSTSGWPSGPVQALRRDSNIKLLPFDLAVQPPYQLVRKNYENLDTFNHDFLAAPNLLVTRPVSVDGATGKAVSTLMNCIQKNLRTLQEGKFEPAWAEVKNISETYGWPRFASAGRK
jgi:TRAP-type uncharacterized transport system substrate-binding protein